jgi:hypothetical protein
MVVQNECAKKKKKTDKIAAVRKGGKKAKTGKNELKPTRFERMTLWRFQDESGIRSATTAPRLLFLEIRLSIPNHRCGMRGRRANATFVNLLDIRAMDETLNITYRS